MKKRIIIDVILLVSVFVFPWWLSFFGAVVLMLFFEKFIELIAVGFILDSLYGFPHGGFFGFQYFLTTVMIFLFFIFRFLKSKMIFYRPSQ